MNKASFSRSVKDELARKPLPDSLLGKKAELTAFLFTVGSVYIGGGKRSVHFSSMHSATGRRIFSLWQEAFDLHPTIVVAKRFTLGARPSYVVRIPLEDAHLLLKEMGCWGEDATLTFGADKVYEKASPDVRKAYLRASFLGGGSIGDPRSSYHMEIHCSSGENAEFIAEIAKDLGIRAHFIRDRNGHMVYMKNSEAISDFLKAVGASNSLFEFEDVRTVKQLRNQVNRLVNSETANMTKSIKAAQDQLSDIEKLTPDTTDRLSDRTKDLIEMRVQHPEASLRELGEMMDPPISKSTVEYHFRKVRKLVRSAK